MAGNNNSNDFNNLWMIQNMCDEIIKKYEDETVEKQTTTDTEENFKHFFNICESMIEDSCKPQIQQIESIVNQVGHGSITERQEQLSIDKDDATGYKKYFSIISTTENHVRRFNLRGVRTAFHFVDPPRTVNPVKWFKHSLKNLVKHVTETIPASDFVGLILHTPRLEHGPVWISFRRMDQLHIDIIWDTISNIMQSNADMFIDGNFEVEVTRISVPVGRGRALNGSGLGYAELCRRKYGIVEIQNDDNLCLPRALVIAEAWVKNDTAFKDIVKNRNNIQTIKARSLVLKAGVKIPVDGCGLAELKEFQQYMHEYNIVVYDYGANGSVVFEGSKNLNTPRLNLLYFNNHYNVIKSLTAAFSTQYFCEPCHKPYRSRDKHRCANICAYCCYSPQCSPANESLLCNACNRRFRGQQCLDNHKGLVCNNTKRCTTCFKLYNNTNKRHHVCGEIFCKLCVNFKPPGHKCYMTKDKHPKKETNKLFIYYDFETQQESVQGNNKIHEINLCVVQQTCTACSDISDLILPCNLCGIRQYVFKQEPLASFVQYVCKPRPMFNKITCIAHNAKSFDAQFVLKYLTESLMFKPKLILNGTKILLMEINCKIRFIDSINYLPMSLTALPKAMDLSVSFKKGYFPHLFNIKANEFYVGPIPDTKYYDIDGMNISIRKDFLKWYDNQLQNKVVFRMEQEIVDYCVNDVNILRLACEKFRKTFIEDCKVCPFTEAVTIASACNRVFRRRFLQPETIGIIPVKGYRLTDNQSKIALQWLITEEIVRKIRIEHAGHGKEVSLGIGLKVDGYHAPDRLVFEFMGCFYHGCTSCYKTNRDKESLYNNSKESLNNRFQRTEEKLHRLRELNYNVIVMWECQFRKQLKNKDKKERLQLENHPLIHSLPLKPRNAFFGGRTGNVSLYRKVENDEKIKYVDVCSLYPYICKYGKYPIGHPKIFVADECQSLLGANNNIDNIEGIIKCTVLPPDSLFHPVLPRKVHGKLMFALCRTCCDTLNQNDCSHTIEERQFTGTWVVDEVRRSVKHGYQILHVYEIWQYDVTVFNRDTKSGGLFVNYIDNFLKMKQEASGYPSECVDEASKTSYIEGYLQKEGISLDPQHIEKNAGKRSMAKLMLNSFWGKFAQTENRPRTTVVSSSEELYDLLSNPSITVNRLIPAGERMMYVNWEHQEESIEQLRTVNVVIAAFTTAQARLCLHEYLHKLGTQVLYYDTDSIIYNHSPGMYEPPTGNFLGDLTDELSSYGPGSYIKEFVSSAPKTYGFKVFNPVTHESTQVCKVKGFTLNYKNSQVINFECLKNMILQDTENEEFTPPIITSNNIRNTLDHSVITRPETKIFKFNFMKRRLIDDNYSIPYGYKKCKLNK